MNPKTLTLGLAAFAIMAVAALPPPSLEGVRPARHSGNSLEGVRLARLSGTLPATEQRQNANITALNANLTSGSPTPNSTATCELGGPLNALVVGVQGTYSMTLIVQVTADNVNWTTVPSSSYTKISDGSTGAIGGSGMWTVPASGLAARVTCSAFTSGSAAVSLIPFSAGSSAGGGGGGAVTAAASAFADGSIVTLGTDADSSATGAGTVNAHLRSIANALNGTIGTNSAITNTPTIEPGNTPNTTPWLANPAPTTSGGITAPFQSIAVTNSAVSVKGSAGNFYGYNITNLSAGNVCIELFNTPSVTLGTTVPIWHITLQPGQTANRTLAVPISFGTAIYAAAVTVYNGSTAPATLPDVCLEFN